MTRSNNKNSGNPLRSRRSISTDADILNANPSAATAAQAPAVASQVALPSPQVLPLTPNFVLRRYGGLNVFVPSYSFSAAAAATNTNSHRHSQVQTAPGLTRSQDPEDLSDSSDSNDFMQLSTDLERRQSDRNRDPCGKLTPLCRGRVVLGSGKWIFFFSLCTIAIFIANLALQKTLIEKYCWGLPVYISGLTLGGLSFLTFFLIGITDPGVVPKNYSFEELLEETEEYRNKNPEERYFRYCAKCKTSRPPRTFHCSHCQVCIRQQDTHLWIAGTCIGERNRVSYFFHILFQTLFGAYLLVTSVLIGPHILKGTKDYLIHLLQTISSAVVGMALFFFPQSGILMLFHKLYLIGVGRTGTEEYRKFHCYNTHDCHIQRKSFCTNIRDFFCQRCMPSYFRRRVSRIDPEGILNTEMPDPWILEQTVMRIRPQMLRDSQELIQLNNLIDTEQDEEDIANGNAQAAAAAAAAHNESLRLREVAYSARGKATPSVPQFEHSLHPAMTRIKMPRNSNPSWILQQQINAYQKASRIPKATVSYHKRQKLPVSLSDGCIPRTKNGTQEMIQMSRATQLRRIIQMLILRDREGLIEMSNRVNIAALVGMNRFDPDNLQLFELQNGLPMIAPLRQDVGNQRVLGAGVMAIPQMVAAGLLPTARDIANDVEGMVGPGRVRIPTIIGRHPQRPPPITSPRNGGTPNSVTGAARAGSGAGRRSRNFPFPPPPPPPLPASPTPPPSSTHSSPSDNPRHHRRHRHQRPLQLLVSDTSRGHLVPNNSSQSNRPPSSQLSTPQQLQPQQVLSLAGNLDEGASEDDLEHQTLGQTALTDVLLD